MYNYYVFNTSIRYFYYLFLSSIEIYYYNFLQIVTCIKCRREFEKIGDFNTHKSNCLPIDNSKTKSTSDVS